jgi:putative phosphoesterase
MKLMIASDLHGSYKYAKQMKERYEIEKPEKLILLGDLLYHGPRNDLPEEYAPKSVIAMLNEMKEELLCVRGNCEAEVDQMVLEFPVLADYMILYLEGHMIFVTHGHTWNTKNLPPLKKGDVLLHGHTHIPELKKLGCGTVIFNPGSVSLPKGGSSRSIGYFDGTALSHCAL